MNQKEVERAIKLFNEAQGRESAKIVEFDNVNNAIIIEFPKALGQSDIDDFRLSLESITQMTVKITETKLKSTKQQVRFELKRPSDEIFSVLNRYEEGLPPRSLGDEF